MSESQKPVGYGHDHKGAAGGATVGGGKPGVAHTIAADKSSGEGQGTTAQTFFMDGKEIDIRAGETIFRAGRRHDIKLPHLCYSPKPGYRPDGNCRVCMVEIEGERVLAASCLRTPSPGMKVKTQTDRAKTARRMVAELLMTDQPDLAHAHDPDSELWKIAKRQKIEPGRFPKRERIEVPPPDRSHPAMAVNLDACIQCNLCVRACREVQVNDVIGMAGRGHLEKIVFDFDDPMGDIDLRRLRRMRAGLPDRRADAGDPGRREQRLHHASRTARSTASAPIAASAASSPTTSRTTSSFRWTAATARPTRTGSASRAASASTTSPIRSA